MLKLSRAALLAACFGLAAPAAFTAVPAFAQETQAPAVKFDIKVPSVVAVDSSMTEDQIKAVFTSDFMAQAGQLAMLNAKSITIPEIAFTFEVPGVDAYPSTSSTVTYRDLVLSDVQNGKAAKLTIGGGDSLSQGEQTTYKAISIDNFDLKLALEFAGVVKGDASAAMRPVYTGGTSDGGGITGPVYSCTYGPGTAGQFEARPAKVQLADVIAVFEKFSTASEPPPEAITTIVSFAADLFRSFRGGASKVGAVDCSVPGELPISIKVGGAATGDFEPAIYPEVKVSGIAVDAGPLGTGSLGELVMKTIDLNPTLDALESAAGQLNDAWFEANWRRIIPSVGGLSLSNFAIDSINPDRPEERIQAKIGAFDLSLASYLNGIPTDVSASLTGFEVPLPQDTTDPQIATLLAAGITNVNLGADIAAAWDKDAKTIAIEKLALSALDLGSMTISADMGNATEQLFDLDPNVSMASAFGVTVKEVVINVTDDGLGAIVWPIAAAEQGKTDIEAFRTEMAGFAEGIALQLLGSTDAARQLGAALGDFVTGRKGQMTITITSKDPNGIPIPLFMAAQEDPSILAGYIDVTGSAS